jgi:hypothetical protein
MKVMQVPLQITFVYNSQHIRWNGLFYFWPYSFKIHSELLLLWSSGMWCHIIWYLVDGYQCFKGTHCLQKQVRLEKRQFSRVCEYLVTRLHVTSHKTGIVIMLTMVRTSYTVTFSQMLYTVIGLTGKGSVFHSTVGRDPFSSKYFQVCAVFMYVHKIIT